MALKVGELYALLDIDKSGFTRGLSGARTEMVGFQRDAKGRLHDLRGRFVAEGRASGQGFVAAFRKAVNGGKVSGPGGLLGGVLSAIGSLGQLAMLAGALLSVASSAGSALAALAPLAGAVAAIPAAAFAAGVAVKTLSLATSGVGDAMSAVAEGDAKKLDKALKELSPAARAFVLAFRDIYPELKKVQQAVQETFFKPLVDDVKPLAKLYIPVLKRELVGIAATLNDGAQAFFSWAREARTVKDVQSSLSGTQRVVASLTDTVKPLSRAFLNLVVTGLPLIERAGRELAGWAKSFDSIIESARDSGALTGFFNQIGTTFAQVGRIGRNIGQILAAIFSGGQESAGTFLDTLERITARIRDFLTSARGQELVQVFTSFAAQAGPVLFLVGAIASAVGSLGTALASLMSPVTLVIGGLAAIGGALYLAYQQSEAFRNAVNATFVALVPIVATSVREIAMWLREELLPRLREIGELITPMIVKLAQAWQQHVLPAIRAVAVAYAEQLQPTLAAISAFIDDRVIPGINELRAAYQRNRGELQQVASWVLRTMQVMGEFGALISGATVRALITLGGYLVKLAVGQLAMVMTYVRGVVSTFNSAAAAAGRLGSAVGSAVSTAISWLASLPGRARSAMGNLGNVLYGAGQDLIRGLTRGIMSAAGSVADAARSAVSSAISAAKSALGISSPSKVFAQIGRQTAAGLVMGMDGSRGAVRASGYALASAAIPGAAGLGGGGSTVNNRTATVNVYAGSAPTERQIQSALRYSEALLAPV